MLVVTAGDQVCGENSTQRGARVGLSLPVNMIAHGPPRLLGPAERSWRRMVMAISELPMIQRIGPAVKS
jgi:hypothetical protein